MSRLQGLAGRGKGLSSLSKGAANKNQQQTHSLDEMKKQIHEKLIAQLDWARLNDFDQDVIQREIRMAVERMCDNANPLLNKKERDTLVNEITSIIFDDERFLPQPHVIVYTNSTEDLA